MKQISVISIILLFCAQILSAQNISLSPIFGSGMVIQQESEVKIWGWAEPGAKVNLKLSWDKAKHSAITGKNGKWEIPVITPEASFQPLEIIVSSGRDKIVLTDVLAGDVWFLGGQSNMEMDFNGNPDQPTNDAQKIMLRANHKGMRLFRVADDYALYESDTIKVDGQWKKLSPESVKNFSVIGYIFGEKIYQMEKIPIGLVQSAHGASTAEAWIDRATLQQFGEFDLDFEKRKVDMIWYPVEPTLLYNKMLKPLLPIKIKGVVWYQGEANVSKPEQYSRLFPLMINKWREYFEDSKLPFYYVQIAPYVYGDGSNCAELREVQLQLMDKMENIGMAVTLDVGEEHVIHPARKEVVGERLSYWALNKVYGHTALGCRGPEVDKMTVKDSVVTLTFKYAPNGLSFFGKKVTGFEVAGEDKVFHPAQARVKPAFWGNEGLEVWSSEVPCPVAVRYGYSEYIDGCLFNTEGLPASSFRTDNW